MNRGQLTYENFLVSLTNIKETSMKTKSPSTHEPTPQTKATSPTHNNTLQSIHSETTRRPLNCEWIEGEVNNYLQQEKELKHNSLSHCDEKHEGCSCGRPKGENKSVDLVILMDSSSSMTGAAKAVSDAAPKALEAAKADCPSDLRVVWLVVDSSKTGADAAGSLGDITSTLVGTPFTQSHQQYLASLGSTGPFKQDEPQPPGDTTYPGEEGADSIADLCNFFDWRPSACKAIFYISDTALDGLNHDAVDVAASTNAMTAAIANGVVIFAHKIDPGGWPTGPAVNQSYQNMCDPTGGNAYIGPVATDQYKLLIKDAICKACGAECKEVDLPKIEPCVSIVWGDSDCDCFETDDVETAIISICNCYSNIAFTNVHISYFYITMSDGSPVPLLPDGTPSVTIVPVGPICFGDIGPCKEGTTNCISREIVIRTRGAKSGKYNIQVGGICYEIVLRQMHNECFTLTLCQD
jgi:hypothetical protein